VEARDIVGQTKSCRKDMMEQVSVFDVSRVAAGLHRAKDDHDTADCLIRVEWLKTVDPKQAVHEKGFFGNQNSVARPRSPKGSHPVERLKVRFSIE